MGLAVFLEPNSPKKRPKPIQRNLLQNLDIHVFFFSDAAHCPPPAGWDDEDKCVNVLDMSAIDSVEETPLKPRLRAAVLAHGVPTPQKGVLFTAADANQLTSQGQKGIPLTAVTGDHGMAPVGFLLELEQRLSALEMSLGRQQGGLQNQLVRGLGGGGKRLAIKGDLGVEGVHGVDGGRGGGDAWGPGEAERRQRLELMIAQSYSLRKSAHVDLCG